MRRDRITLGTLFLQQSSETAETTVKRLEEHGEIERVRKSIEERAGKAKISDLPGRLRDYIEELLDIDLRGILKEGWKKFEKIEKFLEKSEKSPDKIFYLALAEHSILSQHHPYIEISVNEKVIEKIVFDISLKLTLKGFILEIRNAEIIAVETGECIANGKVSCKGAVLIEKKGEKVKLPGKIVFQTESKEER